MTRRFAGVSIALTACVSLLVGMVVSGSLSPSMAVSTPVATTPVPPGRLARAADPVVVPGLAGVVNFADVAERVNPAVVNIEARSRRRGRGTGGGSGRVLEDPLPLPPRESPRPGGAGTGFIIDAQGHILTNHHVIDGAERITVKLADGRSLRAEVVGADPDTDIAVIRVHSGRPLPHVVLGDSSELRVGEWVCAIGNPLAYEHTVTVGVVSFIGRKLFDMSLDNYIQTDAAIYLGNSGGPLINTRGEVIGINTAVSRQASNIGFAVPINQAKAILPQLLERGYVQRGYIGVALRDVDPDLQEALGLARAAGALVQDVTPGSPAERAGIRPYDLVTAVDGVEVLGNDELIREIASRAPGTTARLEVVRDGRARQVLVKLAERTPARAAARRLISEPPEQPAATHPQAPGPEDLGLTLIEITARNAHRFDLPPGMTGLLVQRVEPMSAAQDAGLERGHILLEVNRQPVSSIAALRTLLAAAEPGHPLAVYVYVPEIEQRSIRTLRLDSR